MQYIEHRFGDLSQLEYRIQTCRLGGKHHATAMILGFSGRYGVGSAGNGDSEFMRITSLAALSAWRVHAVVFDLRQLKYEWGNGIWSVFGHGIDPSGVDEMPVAMVVSDLCRNGFSTCAGMVPKMFDDIDSALLVWMQSLIVRIDADRRIRRVAGPRPHHAPARKVCAIG